MGALALALLVGLTVVTMTGGFERATEPASRIEVGQTVEYGPFDLTVTGAHSIVTAPVLDDEPPERELVLTLRLRLRPSYATTTTVLDQVRLPTSAVLVEDGRVPNGRVRHLDDGRAAYSLNPGQTYDIGLVWPQPPEWDDDTLEVELRRLFWIEEDTLTGLDHQRWGRLKEPQFLVSVPVEGEDG